MPRSRNRLLATLAYGALAATDATLAGQRAPAARRARLVTKPLLMPALALSTRLGAQGTTTPLFRGVQAAQLLSWGGDLALLGHGRRSFLTGVGSFGAAHVGYIAGFLAARDRHAGVGSPGVRAGATAWLATAPLMSLAAGRRDPALPAPIAGYAAVLAGMFATSTLLDRSTPTGARRRVVAGTSLFLLSDSLLGVQRFLRSEPSPLLESAVMATYTTGQWLIAEGAVSASKGSTA